MSNRVNAKLYKIQDLIVENVGDSEEFIDQMVDEYYNKSGHQFINVDLRRNLIDGEFQSKLFIYTMDEKKPYWLNFLMGIVDDEDDLSDLEIKYSSFILFIYNESRIYAITKGYYGRHLMDEYLDKFFGLEVLSRLVDIKVTEIRKIEERGVFGIVLGAERYFREEYNLSYEDDFGKIYRTMLASINEEYFERLGILKKREDITKVSILGSSSLEVSTNFDYNELIQRINKIEELLLTEGVKFNQFYRLSSSELNTIEENLNNELIKMAYDSYSNSEAIDFYHPDIFNYTKATLVWFDILGSHVEIPLGHSFGFINTINKLVQEDIIDSSTEANFIESMKNCNGGFSINQDQVYSNEKSLDKWISGEIEFDGNRFFKLDNDWYKYRIGFNEYLNSHLENLNFESFAPPMNLNDWNIDVYGTEGLYNEHYKQFENFIVADTAFLYYLEICDLIRITENHIYLYHVKRGLGRDLRVLANQIINASRVLKNAISEVDSDSLKIYYNAISNKQYDNDSLKYLKDDGKEAVLSAEGFISLFKTKKISFVFAYSSNSQSNIKDEIKSTNSCIAKLSLLYCIRDMKNTDYEFLIERINES